MGLRMGIRAATVRTFALVAARGAEERETWETATFRVRGKIFAMFSEHERHIWIKSVHDEQRALVAMDPDAWFVPPYVGPSGWVGRGALEGRRRRGARAGHRGVAHDRDRSALVRAFDEERA